jgi:hypothetical protein
LKFEEFMRILRICGSVRVTYRANVYRRKNIRSPPNRLEKQIKVADPMTIATKNRRLSTPHIVRGLLMDL